MILIKLYSDLQINPKSIETYRKIKEYYESIGMHNESEAFNKLIERKFHDNSAYSNQK